jgi:hypothetical protein
MATAPLSFTMSSSSTSVENQEKEVIGSEDPKPVKKRSVPMSSEQQRLVAKMLGNKDISFEAIAQRTGCSRKQVRYYASTSGAPERTAGRKPKDTGLEIVAAKPEKKTRRELAPRLNDEQKTRLRELLEDTGHTMTAVQIAAAVKCTIDQVSAFKKKLRRAAI